MRVNVLGNGPSNYMFHRGTKGKLLVCNMPPFELNRQEVHASCMVDFKMMKALAEGHVRLDMYDWVLGARPRKWMEMQPNFYLKYSPNIRDFHTHIPDYAALPGQSEGQAATNYSCGHMAVDYACRKMGATEVHMYGFDSIFELDLTSSTDLILESDRGTQNTYRLANNWRPIFSMMFQEFKDVQFYIYHRHTNSKVQLPENVTIKIGGKP